MKNSSEEIAQLEKVLDQLIETSYGRRTFLASFGLIMASCATPEKTRMREGDNSGQATELSFEDEKRMTNEVMPQMRKDYPALNNSSMQNYISDLGQKVVRANNLIGNPYQYTFTVVDVNQVNAFALPAGTVFVTAPLIAMADSEAELAGVIGHEVGHIQARHTAERMEKAKREQSSSWKYAAGGGLLGGLLGYGLGKLACKQGDDACIRKATETGAVGGLAGGMLVQKYKFMANSREDEMEADRIGFKTSLNAGYSKDHVGLFYEKLLKMEQQSGGNEGMLKSLSDAMSTHPPSKERVAQMTEMAQRASNKSNAIVSTNDFARMRQLAQQISSAKKS